ncbi:glutathione S-transferase family protein [Celeribacter ethanolicus]|uniref:glutathione S-transferase family protein n=1 Tax=Celeribacter ethanolicus TaxID=1758178 RepID=UPI00083266BC|nr:glutathione S-transferase family protein [Celeribacter ethanolicus]
MYTLYYYPANANAAPHMMLEEIGTAFELSLVDRKTEAQKSAAFLAINPNGRIPALSDGGLVIFEAAAIALYLADKHPGAHLAPAPGTPERARFYQWLIFLTNSLQEELMIWQYPERLTGSDTHAEAVVKAGSEARINAYLDVIEAHLAEDGPYFMGDRISAADFYLTMLCRWARPMATPPRSYPSISRLLDLMTKRPSVQRAYAAEGIEDGIA